MKIKTMLKFLLCFLIISALCISAFAYAVPSANYFFNQGTPKTDVNIVPAKHIQSLIMLFGTLLAIVVILIYGIQWVTATSSKRQELKAGLWPLTIGIILLVIGPKMVLSVYDAFFVSGVTLDGNMRSVAGRIITVVQTLGYIVAIIMILWVGIQWVTSNPNKRQELKSRMLNIAIGAILIAAGVTILDWIANIATNDMTAGIEAPHVVAQNIEDIKL